MNMSGRSKASNVLGGKTARACDSCLVKRARWFCAADDAFLCQSCDAAVHSANQLASRHERVRLEASSCKPSPVAAPAWHQGFTKKARTPRHGAKSSSRSANHHRHQQQPPLVPEMGSDDPFPEENDEEQFLCRVPEFDDEYFRTEMVKGEEEEGFGMMSMVFDDDDDRELNLEELLMSSCDDEFAKDVESLLGMEKVEKVEGDAIDEKRVKLEEKEEDNDVDDEIACHFDPALDAELNWDFDCTMSEDVVREGEDMVKNDNIEMESNESSQLLVSNNDNKRNKLLKLNYEAVMAAWATRGSNSPWTDGIRPQHFDLDEFMGASWMDEWGGRRWRGKDAAGREARVSRYREKRRTRLFSKKIRYEVRKLNAEKRPRMKGRFVKRTTFLGSSSLPYHLINQKS